MCEETCSRRANPDQGEAHRPQLNKECSNGCDIISANRVEALAALLLVSEVLLDADVVVEQAKEALEAAQVEAKGFVDADDLLSISADLDEAERLIEDARQAIDRFDDNLDA